MKHILHKNVSGKTGSDGEKYFQIYITFTENRISYRLKSQLATRPVTKKEFDKLTGIYDGKISDLLNKERTILYHCRDRNMKGMELDRDPFRQHYIELSTCLIDIVRQTKSRLPISDWSIPNISWELTKELDLEHNLSTMSPFKGYTDQDFFELEIYMLDYQREMRRRNFIEGLFLVYDWEFGALRNDFNNFLKSKTNTQTSARLIQLLDTIMSKK